MNNNQGPSTPSATPRHFFTSTPVTKTRAKFQVFNVSSDDSILEIPVIPKSPKTPARVLAPRMTNLPPRPMEPRFHPTMPRTPRCARPTIAWLAKSKKPKEIQKMIYGANRPTTN
ncbi:unnamed protein product [Caenorhabditis angaria]|uniref:Uncharacterized protein n=1 Tax=Caenorhabditis angaria TaxID=860376 RepID=A0A9P1IIN5_9PELO|nr:unnamed protein product [Caenorhabditis angaria]